MNSASDQISASNARHDSAVRRARWRRPLQWFLITFATLVVLIAALLGAFGIVVGRVPEYRIQVQDWLSERTGLVVEFRALSARLRLVGPELVFDDAVVRTPDRTQVLAAAKRGSVGFDVWSSLRNGQLSAGRFWLHSPQISLLRTKEGRIQLLGQSALAGRADAKPIAVEQLPTGRFEVTDAVVHFRDEVTGRGPWSMSGVSFDLTRDVGAIRLTGEASLPRTLGHTLTFAASATGELQDPHAVVSKFEVSGKELDLSGWADVVPDEWPAPETGRGSIELAGALRGPALMQISARIDFQKISTSLPMWTLPLPGAVPMRYEGADSDENPLDDGAQESESVEPDPVEAPIASAEMVSYERVAFGMRATRSADEWTAGITDLEVTRAGRSWQANRIEAKWVHGAGAINAMANADRIDLGSVWPLLAYLPESEQLARVRALRANGLVENFSLTLQRAAADAALTYAVESSLEGIGFSPVERAPGLSGISGRMRADQDGGQLKLASEGVRFELPRMFREVLAAHSATGEIDWAVDERGINVHGRALRIRGDDGAANADARVFVPRDRSSPILQISARGESLKAASAGRYVPGNKLRAETLEWFDRAFVGGTIRAATFEMEGPLRLFPFRDGEGTFKASADVENATLAYHEDWEPATGIQARVEFHNESMLARASSLQVGKLQATEASAWIDDLKDTDLKIEAVTNGDLQEALQFLRGSPIAAALAPHLANLDGQGALTAKLNLLLPIKRMHERDIEVAARIQDGTVTHRELDAPVTALDGSLTVRNTLVAAADLNGRWLNGPLRVSVRAQSPTRSVLQASGKATAAQLKSLLALPETITISGAADWRMTTLLASGARERQGGSNVHVSADLREFGLMLPRPVGKLEGEPRQLELDISLDERRALLRASLGDLRALLRLRRSNEEWSFDRGGLRADGLAASLPSHRGLRIEGEIDRLVLDDWLALRGQHAEGRPLSDYLQGANVRVESFELFGYQWRDLRGILQATPSGWQVDVNGPDAQGQIILPASFSGAAPLSATMDHLSLVKSARERTERDGESLDPRRLPPLDLRVIDLRFGQRTIGAVDIEAVRVPRGLRFERINVSGASAQAEGRGEWLADAQGGGSHASLAATVTSEDVAATLTALSYTPILEAERGEIKAQLRWPGGYDRNILEQASGSISVRAEAGQIVNVQPGAGRMLGLFSVAALPRRLALDFSDLTDKGLAFDSIHGDFELRAGDAYTSNLLLRGPAAEIGIAGRTGFGSRDYDQTAIVTGNLGASLPVAGALAGGPAVGAALLLFSQVFKEPLRGMTRGYYRITGPWDNPSVERIEASDAKDATARVVPAAELQ